MTSVLAGDLGGTNLRLALVDESGTILDRRHATTPERGTFEDTLGQLTATIDDLLGGPTTPPVAGCMATAGLVDNASGRVMLSANIPGFRDAPLAARLSDRYGIDVLVENDASAAALAEYRFGAGRGVRHLLHATLGTGIGGGLVIDGRLYRGHQGYAGEIGHIIVDMGGPLCVCGQRGCVEAFVSGTAFTRRGRALIGSGRAPQLAAIVGDREPQGEDLLAAARAGETASQAEIRHAGHVLGVGLANAINLLNPDRVTLSGGLLAMGDLLLDETFDAVRSKAYGPAAGVEIRLTELTDEPGILGAAAVAFERLDQAL